jgi:23S rRNA (uracil1939-C5)-methyltransferase
MSVAIGSLITLDIEKPAVGGRMLARHGGQIVLVWGAVPGERVQARVERAGRGVLYAETIEVLTASPDRRAPDGDWRCGGNVYAHVAYDRQVRLKGEIIRETLGRIGRIPLDAPPVVVASPEHGYRMRARLHAATPGWGSFARARINYATRSRPVSCFRRPWRGLLASRLSSRSASSRA